MPTPDNFSAVNLSDSKGRMGGQFSSKMSGNPEELLDSTKPEMDKHANLIEAYGLCQPVAGLGVTPWLRDSLADPSEYEPGNAVPTPDVKNPLKG